MCCSIPTFNQFVKHNSVDKSHPRGYRKYVEKGYINRQFTVWCGLCQNWEQASVPTIAMMKKQAKAWGWKETRKHGWVCPDCQKKKKPDGLHAQD